MKSLRQKLAHEMAVYERQQGYTNAHSFPTSNISMCHLWEDVKEDYQAPEVAERYEMSLSNEIREWHHLPNSRKDRLIINEIMKGVRSATE